jgi:hypothetical protein
MQVSPTELDYYHKPRGFFTSNAKGDGYVRVLLLCCVAVCCVIA